MKMIMKGMITTALYLFSISVFADTNIVGSYNCQRTDASGASTSYPMSIKKTADTYTFEWDDSSGNPGMYGTGIMHPNVTTMVSTSFWDITNSDVSGVMLYAIKPDGSLQGSWIMQSGKSSGTEVCKKS